MINVTQEQIEERFNALPVSVQEALASAKTGERLRRIGTRHDLHIDQLGILNNITGFVILGFLERSEYLPTLIEELNISRESAGAILEDVNTEILAPIRTSLEGSERGAEEEADSEDEQELPTRDELLREIEDSLPVSKPEEAPAAVASMPIGVSTNSENAPGEAQHLSIVEKKLSGETALKEAQTIEKKEGASSPASPSSQTVPDPYREAIE